MKENNSNLRDAAVSILFSVSNSNVVIEEGGVSPFQDFFTALSFSDDNPTAQNIALSEAMQTLDWSERWVYKGSKTQPPCEQFVYWNVLK